MKSDKDKMYYIINLQKLELDEDEALIYFTLLKHGRQGTIARKLNEDLFSIERTRIYSILRKLIEKGCIIEGPPSEDVRKPKTFIAEEPTKYIDKIFSQIKQRLKELEEFRKSILIDLNNLYESGLEISVDKIDPFILPYLQPLLKNKWKIKTQKIEKGINLLGSDLYYEYQFLVPKELYKTIRIVGFTVSVYDSDIKKDDISLKFFIKQLKKVLIKTHQADFEDIDISDNEIDFFGKKFPSIVIKGKEKKSQTLVEFGGTLILPINNKIFFIWEEIEHNNIEFDKKELHNLLEEIAKIILKVEKII